MTRPNGVHHLAIMTADVKAQVAFFADVLGMKLKALYWMHNVEGYFHAFMELNPSVTWPSCSPRGQAHRAGTRCQPRRQPGQPCAAGVTQHIAFNVDSVDDLLAMRDRIRAHGVRVLGPLDHGFCQSIYFGGPEDLVLKCRPPPAASSMPRPDRPGSGGVERHYGGRTRALQESAGLRQHQRTPRTATGAGAGQARVHAHGTGIRRRLRPRRRLRDPRTERKHAPVRPARGLSVRTGPRRSPGGDAGCVTNPGARGDGVHNRSPSTARALNKPAI